MGQPWVPWLASDEADAQPALGPLGIQEGEFWDFRPEQDLIYATWKLQFGAGMLRGEGDYLVTLPVPCASPAATPIGLGYAYQTIAGQIHGNARLIEPVALTPEVATLFISGDGQNHHVRHDNPWLWRAGYFLKGTLFYKPA